MIAGDSIEGIMKYGFKQKMVMWQECSVCGKPHGFDESEGVITILNGAVDYAICCCCNQTVEDHRDENYRQRFDDWAKNFP